MLTWVEVLGPLITVHSAKSGDRSGGDLDVPAVEIYVKQNPNRIEEDTEDDRSWQFKNILEGKARYTKAGFIVGRKPSKKKAIVTVAKGETIDLYGNSI